MLKARILATSSPKPRASGLAAVRLALQTLCSTGAFLDGGTVPCRRLTNNFHPADHSGFVPTPFGDDLSVAQFSMEHQVTSRDENLNWWIRAALRWGGTEELIDRPFPHRDSLAIRAYGQRNDVRAGLTTFSL